MAFINFQRYVCDGCGASTTQAGASDWFELHRRDHLADCYQGYAADACSMDCLARVAALPMNRFKQLKKETQQKADSVRTAS